MSKNSLISNKIAQAKELVARSQADVWLTFVRETAENGDPILPFIVEGGLTWQTAFLIFRSGKTVAVVGNYDADPLVHSGNWDEVVTYVQGIREPLLATLDKYISESNAPVIAVNYSKNDVKADGLSHGMYELLTGYLENTRFASSLVSAEDIVVELRSVKTDEEIQRITDAISETDTIFEEVSTFARIGTTEQQVYDFIQSYVDSHGFGYSWARAGDPIVNSGPNSMIGHGIPSADICLEPGHVFHIDLGIIRDGYSSDIQRCWYVATNVSEPIPDDVQRAVVAINAAITAGAATLKPGVMGWEVDKAARDIIVAHGYDEFMHAFGHQVGRVAHDGGGILGPRWERYGQTPYFPIKPNQVYTLELGVVLPDRGYLGIEEIVVVTDDGCRFLSERQLELWRVTME